MLIHWDRAARISMESYHSHLWACQEQRWFGDWFSDADKKHATHNILATGCGQHLLSSALMGWISHTISKGVPFILAANRNLCLMVSEMALAYGYDVITASQENTGADKVKNAKRRPTAIILFMGEFESDSRIGCSVLGALLDAVLKLQGPLRLAIFLEELPRFGAIEHFEQAVMLSHDTQLRFGLTAQRFSDIEVAYPGTATQIAESCWHLT